MNATFYIISFIFFRYRQYRNRLFLLHYLGKFFDLKKKRLSLCFTVDLNVRRPSEHNAKLKKREMKSRAEKTRDEKLKKSRAERSQEEPVSGK